MNKNQILIENLRKVIVEQGESQLSDSVLASALHNLSDLGFTFSSALIDRVRTLSNEQFSALYFEILPILTEMVGYHVSHKPMYPNFPREVMEMDEAQLYINAILHYVHSYVRDLVDDTEGVVVEQGLPLQIKTPRPTLPGGLTPKVLDLGDETDLLNFTKKLISAKTSISEQHKDIISFVVQTYEASTFLPEEIALKENVGFVVAELLKQGKVTKRRVKKYFKTATDVLRLLVAYSDGDVSLAENTLFVSFPRRVRKLALSLLESCSSITEDMLRYSDVWKRVAEGIHPFEFKTRYPKTAESFRIICEGLSFSTFASRVEKSLAERDLILASHYLSARPGEFARRLDHMLRLSTSQNASVVLDSFKEVSSDVSTPVLLSVIAHFEHRDVESEIRSFFPKGNVGKLYAIQNTHKPLESKLTHAVVTICKDALIARFAQLPSLGKVYVDPALQNYNVPFAQRSASKALVTIARGSRVAFPEGSTIRAFIYWHEGQMADGNHTGRIDLDLSTVMFSDSWENMGEITYYNLRDNAIKSCHSGDITSAPNGASEFIDVDIESAVNAGVRYIIISVNSYTQHPFFELPQCFSGWMMRSAPDSGEIFEPTTVVNKYDLSADTQAVVPVILDLVSREAIWCDLGMTTQLHAANNVENNKHSLQTVARAIATMQKPDLFTLFSLHASARASERVACIEEADTIFAVNQGIKPTDFTQIAADFF